MPWLVDGSNVLGAMRVDRHDDDAKRALVRRLAAFAREKKTRVSCVFDGPEPGGFGLHLGSVTVAFSGGVAADDVIAERAAHARGWKVVTSDQGLAARVRRRGVEVVASAALIQELQESAAADGSGEADWAAYFSDPKNRLKF